MTSSHLTFLGIIVDEEEFPLLREILLGWLGEQVDLTGPTCDLARNLLARLSAAKLDVVGHG